MNTYTCTECYNTTNTPGKCPNCGADTIINAVYDMHGLPKENINTMPNTIIDPYVNECYQFCAQEEGQHSLLVPFTGVVSEYLFEAVRLGFSAPFYHGETYIESLFYATAERNEFRIHNWLRDNGGIDAWMTWTDNGLVPVCQINPRFDVEDQMSDINTKENNVYIHVEYTYTDGITCVIDFENSKDRHAYEDAHDDIVRQLEVDENGCHTTPDGNCISKGNCMHSEPF